MEKEELLSIVTYRVDQAKGSIEESESHLKNGFLTTAMNRIYYAGFYIVSALAALEDFPTAKHKQLIGWFNKEYLKTGKVDREVGKILRKAYDRRMAADYHDFVYLTRSQIDEYRIEMKKFIEEVHLIIQGKIAARK